MYSNMSGGSRAPGGFGTSDVRTAAILQDYLYNTDPCTPGAEMHRKCGRTYIAECGEPPCGFDRPKYLIIAIMALLITAVVIGLLNCFGLYISVVEKVYGLGFIEICFVAAFTYAVFIKISCLSSFMIGWVGHRNTALIGMIIFFLGILLDAFTLHPSLFYIVHIIFFAIGGGLAYGSAMSVSGDLFRKNLSIAMVLVSVGGCIGTILFYWCNMFLLSRVSYRWTKLCMAMLVILFTGATHLFPNFTVDTECAITTADANNGHAQRDQEIRQCINKAAKRNKTNNPPQNATEKSYLCVCLCDVALWSDWSFVLWGCCVLIATMALFVPYMFILAFAETIPIILSPWYITVLCIASIIGRGIILMGTDFTFNFTRLLFMCGVLGSGILWIVLPIVETFGWLVIWCGLMGIMEGLIVGCIPRLTLLTIPRLWIESSWGWIMWFHAVGVFIITMFVAVISREILDFFMAFTVIGILQIIGGLMAFLLPNEEDCEALGSDDCDETGPKTQLPFTSSPRPYSMTSKGSYGLSRLTTGCFGSSYGGRAMGPESGETYGCCCHICKAAGCIPECPGCVPGELAGVSPPSADPCGGSNATSSEIPSNTSPSMAPSSSKSKATDLHEKNQAPSKAPSNTPSKTQTQIPSSSAPSPSGKHKDDDGVVKRTTFEIKKTTKTPT